MKHAEIKTVRSLSEKTEGSVRILCIVVEARPGVALVQDIYDEVGKAGTIKAIVEGTLNVAEKYILIGDVTQKESPNGNELMLAVSLAHNVNTLDIKLYKEVLELEGKVTHSLSG